MLLSGRWPSWVALGGMLVVGWWRLSLVLKLKQGRGGGLCGGSVASGNSPDPSPLNKH